MNNKALFSALILLSSVVFIPYSQSFAQTSDVSQRESKTQTASERITEFEKIQEEKLKQIGRAHV